MKLKTEVTEEIVNKCVGAIISNMESEICKLPFDVILSEIAELVGDIEDRIDSAISSKIEEIEVTTVEELWENKRN